MSRTSQVRVVSVMEKGAGFDELDKASSMNCVAISAIFSEKSFITLTKGVSALDETHLCDEGVIEDGFLGLVSL